MPMERPFSKPDWLATPEPVRRYVEALEQRIERLEVSDVQVHHRIEQLEIRLNQNSQNSSKPPSSDPPYQRPERVRRKSKRRRGGQKGHKGYRQQMLKPTETQIVDPGPCACGCTRRRLGSVRSFDTHQWIELPEIEMQVKHVVLKKGQYAGCGRWVKAKLPTEYQRLWPSVQCPGGRAEWHPGDQPQSSGRVHPERFRCSHLNGGYPKSDRPGLCGACPGASSYRGFGP
jgi:hypothetical protein